MVVSNQEYSEYRRQRPYLLVFSAEDTSFLYECSEVDGASRQSLMSLSGWLDSDLAVHAAPASSSEVEVSEADAPYAVVAECDVLASEESSRSMDAEGAATIVAAAARGILARRYARKSASERDDASSYRGDDAVCASEARQESHRLEERLVEQEAVAVVIEGVWRGTLTRRRRERDACAAAARYDVFTVEWLKAFQTLARDFLCRAADKSTPSLSSSFAACANGENYEKTARERPQFFFLEPTVPRTNSKEEAWIGEHSPPRVTSAAGQAFRSRIASYVVFHKRHRPCKPLPHLPRTAQERPPLRPPHAQNKSSQLLCYAPPRPRSARPPERNPILHVADDVTAIKAAYSQTYFTDRITEQSSGTSFMAKSCRIPASAIRRSSPFIRRSGPFHRAQSTQRRTTKRPHNIA